MSKWIGRSALVSMGLAISLAVAFDGGAVFAQDDPIKVRRAAMKQLGAHMKGVGGFLKGGRRAGTAETVALRGQSIAAIAGKIPALFPKGTSLADGKGETGAKPVIWEQWPAFQKAAANLTAEANKLTAAAEGGDKAAIKAAMASLGKNGCGGCHRTFRQKLKK